MNVNKLYNQDKQIDLIFLFLLCIMIYVVFKISSLMKNPYFGYNQEELKRKMRILALLSIILLLFFIFKYFKKYRVYPTQNEILIFLLILFIIGFGLVKMYLAINNES